MTNRSPRIYTYKITFEEVPYYYYGVHKEKKFNEEYWGTPITCKWVWDFYTPKKQILELFDYSDTGWLKSQKVEKRLIYPVYNTDKCCLNKNCGGMVSIEISRKNGKRLHQEKIGFHSHTEKKKIEVAKMGGQASYDLKTGVHARTKKQMSEDGKKAYQMRVGAHGLTIEEKKAIGKKSCSQIWECTITGYRTNAPGLTNYQKSRGIDKSLRVRIS
jgi:hypothetical protein